MRWVKLGVVFLLGILTINVFSVISSHPYVNITSSGRGIKILSNTSFKSAFSKNDSPKSHFSISPNRRSLINKTDLINDGEYFAFENLSIKNVWEFPNSSYHSISPSALGPPLVEVSGELYLAYVKRTEWFRYEFIITHSKDGGRNWEEPIEIKTSTNTLNATCRIAYFNGKFYYMMATQDLNGGSKVEVVSNSNWRDLPSQTPIILSKKNTGSEYLFMTSSSKLLAFLKEDNSSLIMFSTAGGPWGRKKINTTTNFFNIISDSTGKLLLYFTSSIDNGIKLMTSTDGGDTWSSPIGVLAPSREISQFGLATGGGKIYLAALFYYAPLKVLFSESTDGFSWDTLKIVTGYNKNYQDVMDDVSIAYREGKIIIAYENSSGRISILNSTDGGATWKVGATLSDTHAHAPALDRGGKYLLYMEINHLNFCLLDRHQYTASLKTQMLFIPAFKSWEDVGVNTYEYSKGNISVRILNSDGDVVYPQNGNWAQLQRIPEKELEGEKNNFYHQILWPANKKSIDKEGVTFEFNFTRVPEELPKIWEVVINYSTAFPYREDFRDKVHFSSLNLTWITNGELTLIPGSSSGSGIIGPVIPDEPWPPVLRTICGGFIKDDKISVSLLDRDMDPINGFSGENSDNVINKSGEKLIRWNGNILEQLPTFMPIYIEIKIERGLGAPSLKDLYIEYSAPPSLSSAYSEYLTINRTKTTKISVELEDREDDPSTCNVEIEYRTPSGSWSNSFLSNIMFNQGIWSTYFSPPVNSETGNYSFRINATDPHGNSSGWMIFPFTIKVRNNLPTTPKIEVDPNKPSSVDNLTVRVVEPSVDVETPQNQIKYNYYFYQNRSLKKSFINRNELSVVLPSGTLRKHETWMVLVSAFDGENNSNPASLIVYINNSPPEVLYNPGVIVFQEDNRSEGISLNSIFRDVDNDVISYIFNSTNGISVNRIGDTIYIVPRVDFWGNVTLNITASDGESSTILTIPVVIQPVNDPPQWHPINDYTVLQDTWLKIDIVSWDRDNERVRVESNLFDIFSDLKPGINYFAYPNGSFKIKTDNSMVGTHDVMLTFSDGHITLSCHFNITVINVDDPPSKPIIETSLSENIIVVGRNLTLIGNSTDPDELWGQQLEYSWSSSIQGYLGNGKVISVSLTIPGTHVINLTVSDGNHTTFNSVKIVVIRNPTSQKAVDKTLLIVLTGTISLAVGIIASYLLWKKKGKKEAKKTEKKEGIPVTPSIITKEGTLPKIETTKPAPSLGEVKAPETPKEKTPFVKPETSTPPPTIKHETGKIS